MNDDRVSIFNDVMGPIMRGPSSSHTAAAHRLGRCLHSIFPGKLKRIKVVFRAGQTFSLTYRQQRSDLAFCAGFLGLDVRDPAYDLARETASSQGLEVEFLSKNLDWGDHPNDLEMVAEGAEGESLTLKGCSVGGGSVRLLGLNRWRLTSQLDTYDILIEGPVEAKTPALQLLSDARCFDTQQLAETFFLRAALPGPPGEKLLRALAGLGVKLWPSPPVSFITGGEILFIGAEKVLAYCRKQGRTLSQAGLDYEEALTGQNRSTLEKHSATLVKIMLDSIASGLYSTESRMILLSPSAGRISAAEAGGSLFFGGLPTRTASWALAAMEHCSSGGLVCAAPTAGSAGILPAALAAIKERCPDNPQLLQDSLLAGAVIGLVFAQGATFAAEVGGCQVEVGASAAMAAGAAMAAAGGSPEMSFQAASLMLQNYMGLVCDPVLGYVEVPCQIRNALAASSVLAAVDLVLGGYTDPIPFDEVVAATLATGRSLPPELRCTSLGGLAACPCFGRKPDPF